MTEAIIAAVIILVALAGVYLVAFLSIWQGAHFIEQLKRGEEEWDA